ncbi:MAG TPA: helix-turn-helix domain-containing protein [Bradyrhizobium sp.]|nr:helix-turn-helix domain-containing protein [Bradyrhizobium sp.]
MPDGLTKSARRVFDILELFRERQSALRLKDVVDALGMPTSSAAALLKTMAQLNYLSFESTSRTYLPTLRLSQLGDWVTPAAYEDGPILEGVRRLGRKLGETILLGTMTDIYVEIVHVLRAREPLQYFTHIGTRVLLAHSGLGWPLLSELRDEEIARIYRRTIRRSRTERLSSLSRLRNGIEQVRREGYCLSRGMVARGVGVVGMMLPTPAGHRRLAIGIAGPQQRIEKNLTRILAAFRSERARLKEFAGEGD